MIRIEAPESLPVANCFAFAFAIGKEGRLIAASQVDTATVIDLERPGWKLTLGRQIDIPTISVSPDGRWVATGSHHGNEGVRVWSIPDGLLVKAFPSPGGAAAPRFSPDGRWLMTNLNVAQGCRVWSVGDWQEGIRVEGEGLGFSPDGRRMAVGQAEVVQLIETRTGQVVAKLENPQHFGTRNLTFSLDSSRLIMPNDRSRVAQVWDLRLIRRQLSAMGLDWDWPELPEPANPASAVTPLRVLVDYGGLDFSLGQLSPPGARAARRCVGD